MKVLYTRPKSMTNIPNRYCPGCGHAIVHRIIAEVIDELNIRENVIGIAPVGCAVFAYDYWNFDVTEASHGRPAAVATGMKRVLPDKIVFAYQGDGDLAAIGLAETVHAANRGENITVIFINNAIYGMTGGQMAPTTIYNQKTTTTPYGRKASIEGAPLKMCELINTLELPVYIVRVSLDTPQEILKTKKVIKKAFENQINKKGYSFVEVLSPCPTNWRLSPIESMKWIKENMKKTFPTGVFRDK